MTRRAKTLWAAAAAFALSTTPALARQAKERPESRPSGGGSSSGTAVSRPSGGGGSGGSSSSGGGSSAGSSSSSGGSASSMPSGGGFRGGDRDFAAPRAPERRTNDRAVSRSGSAASRSSAQGRASGTAAAAPDSVGDQRRAVPAYSRPRGDRPATGTAISRADSPVNGGNGNIIFYPYYPYYDPFYGYGYGYGSPYYGYYGPWFFGYGFGLGYFYDPWGYSYYSPYDSSYSRYGGSSYSQYGRRPTGQLRLKVKPENGQVYVDGYFVGDVDSYDGVMQRLSIEEGSHKVEIRAAGYETVTFDVMVTAGETVTYKGEMKRIK